MKTKYKLEPRIYKNEKHNIEFRYLLKSDIANEFKDFKLYMKYLPNRTILFENEEVYLWEDFCVWHNRRY